VYKLESELELEFLKKKGLQVKDNALFIGNQNCVELAEKYGTPIYVINEKVIKNRYQTLITTLKKYYNKVRIHYAVKANTNMAILSILKNMGAYLDCVSCGEIYIAKKVGFSSDRILYTGNNYRDDELAFALKNKVMLNLDAETQLNRLVKILDKGFYSEKRPLLSFRVNPEFGAGHHDHCITAGPNVKFGILERDIVNAYEKAIQSGFDKFGIHMHIGSGILDADIFKVAANKYINIIRKILDKIKINLEFIDFGGGLGIPYNPKDSPLDLEKYAQNIVEPFIKLIEDYSLNEPYLCIEPGRYIVAESCIILAQVNTIKKMHDKYYAGIDAGLNLLIRPAMYGSYHHVLVANKINEQKVRNYNIAGPICESGDVLARDRKLPNIEEYDIIAILDAGAYGFTMNSNYNMRPRAAEILVSENTVEIVRKGENFEDLTSHQIIPERLK